MGAKSDIEWTDASWTPIRARNLKTGKVGWYCEHATTGCEFCYAEGMNKRLGTGLPFKPGHRKDVELFLDDKMLLAPLRWKKPRMIFVCSMTDLFADFVPDEWIDKVFAVMALTPQHTYQVLTKRADRMRQWFAGDRADCVGLAMLTLVERIPYGHRRVPWPLPNVWLGVSAERQQEADERIPHLLQTPAAVRFISAEPLLGPIDLTALQWAPRENSNVHLDVTYLNAISGKRIHRIERDSMGNTTLRFLEEGAAIDWVIVGGESGHSARPMHPDWARSLRDQCSRGGLAYFFKQWGTNVPVDIHHIETLTNWDGAKLDGQAFFKPGKKLAGRLLDGIEHNAMPRVTA